MPGDLDPTTLEALLSEDSPTVSLQAEVDRQAARIQALERRVEHLERDRSVLRERLAAGGRRSRRRPAPDDPPEPTAPTTTSSSPFAPFPIPDPSPPEGAPRIGAVLDEFSRLAWAFEAPLLHLDATTWRAQLEDHPVDLLFVESAWSGPGGSWARAIGRFGEPDQRLVDLVGHCRAHGIPTIFWNKEDPANFAWFIGSAALFDHVFTVDGDAIPRYREMLGHTRIDLLPFAAQPAIHHPRPDLPRDLGVAFTGSYYAKKHAERRRQMDVLLVPALEYGLDIWDRHAGTADPRFAYPPELAGAVRGSLSYPETLTAHHRYKVFLNVNSVADSSTMCARRVYELVACGTPIISGPSLAIERVFGDIVTIVRSREEASEALAHALTASPKDATPAPTPHQLGGQTYEDRLERVVVAVG